MIQKCEGTMRSSTSWRLAYCLTAPAGTARSGSPASRGVFRWWARTRAASAWQGPSASNRVWNLPTGDVGHPDSSVGRLGKFSGGSV